MINRSLARIREEDYEDVMMKLYGVMVPFTRSCRLIFGRAALLSLLLAGSVQLIMAQQQTITPSSSPALAVQETSETIKVQNDNRYHIGAGDVLEIRVRKSPDLSLDAVKVDQHGMINIPMVEEEIAAACLTEGELAAKINKLYLEYKTQPDVKVYIKEYNAQPVSVIGEVNLPQQFKLQRPARLLEVLTLAGGPKEATAGNFILVIHSPDSLLCEAPRETVSSENGSNSVVSYPLAATLGGDERANPFVRPGDIIKIPEAKLAYVIGNVPRPGTTILLKEPVTASRAIAMAGGTLPDSKTSKVRISRQAPSGMKQDEIFIDIAAIKKHQAEDILLQPGDIIEVETASGKRLLRSIFGTIMPSVTQLPMTVIRGY